MKKIMLIIISVVMFFTACGNQTDNSIEESIPTQIDPAEEFGGVTFGMTKEEVIAVLGREPDYTSEDGRIYYDRQVFFNVAIDSIDYYFDENGNLYSIFIFCFYESAKEQMLIDLDHIKEELSKNYPEYPDKTRTYIHENNEELSLYTENRSISLSIYDDAFTLSIRVKDESE